MLYLFLGQEQFLKKEALEKLKSRVCGSASSSLDYEEFQAGEDDLSKIIEYAKTTPFVSKYRLLLVKDVDKLKTAEKEALTFFIPNKPSSAVIALSASALNAADPVYKIALSSGRLLKFDLLRGERLHKWVSDRFLSLGKKIDFKARQVLIENTGNSLGVLCPAIELLAAFSGRADTISLSDIETLIGKSLQISAYKLIDAVGSKNTSLALQILRDLEKDAKFVSGIIGLMGWYLGRIWRAKRLLNQRIPVYKIAASLRIEQYAVNSFFRQVNNFSAKEAERGLKKLFKLDKDIKSSRVHPYRALEFLIIQLCAFRCH